MASNDTVVGYFPSQATAESAISALKAAGFEKNQIGVAIRSAVAGPATSSTVSDSSRTRTHTAGHHTAGMWEKVKSFFEGSTAEPNAGEATRETFDDREITPQGYGAADVYDSLGGMSVPEQRARYFGNRFGSGSEGAIVTVMAPGREEQAIAILEENGGDVGSNAAQYDSEAETTNPGSAEQNVQLFGEVLRVHKDRISLGDVRLRKEVHTTTQTVQVPVTREELVVERLPVSGEQVADGAAFKEEEIRIPLSEERPSVDKQAVLREQVRVGKKEVTNVESFDEKVRSEELKIDENPSSKTA